METLSTHTAEYKTRRARTFIPIFIYPQNMLCSQNQDEKYTAGSWKHVATKHEKQPKTSRSIETWQEQTKSSSYLAIAYARGREMVLDN